MTELTPLRDVLIVFSVAVIVVAILRRLHVPTIAGFILSGIVIGPWGLGLVTDLDEVHILTEVGIALLLFGIGLEMPLSRVKQLWKFILVGGGLQMGLTATAGTLIAMSFQVPVPSAILLGLILAVSSTAIVLRALSGRGETDAPHGRFAFSVLIFQDLCVVPVLLAIPILSSMGSGSESALGVALWSMVKTLGSLAVILAIAWLVAPRLLEWIARSRQRELFVLTVLVISLGIAYLISSLGISLALGAFLAGLVVSDSGYRHQALTELIPLREVLTSLFFISVGMLLNLDWLGAHAALVAAIVAAVLVAKPLIVFVVANILRLPPRVSAQSALTLAQVGEFGFVIMYAAKGTGLMNVDMELALTSTAVITMIVTPGILAVAPRLSAGVARLPGLDRLHGVPQASDCPDDESVLEEHVVIAGYGVAGQELARALHDHQIPYVIVDLNADNVRAASALGQSIYFGDVTSPEVLRYLRASSASEVVLAINDPGASERAMRSVRSVAPNTHLTVRTRYLLDIPGLTDAGADDIVTAEVEAAVELAARVLSRHGLSSEATRHHQERIRRRQND
jgi:CPA2 family monovalent cation:H+ antiporter-2